MTADGDIIYTPERPIFLLAVAMLAEEKGETGGISVSRRFDTASKSLSDHIAVDAARYPDETTWYCE